MTDTYTTEQLIQSVRLRTRIGTAQIPGARDSDIIMILNEEMKTLLLPALMKPKEDYFVRGTRITMTSGTAKYRIPSRASGLKFRAAYHVDSNSNRSEPLKRVTRLDMNSVPTGTSTTAVAFVLEGPYIVLLPDQSATFTGFLELYFYMRPGDLVTLDNYFKISSVDSTTQVTLEDNVPAEWTTADLYDVHSESSGAEVKCWDRTVSSISGNTVVFSSAIDGSVWGDYPVVAGDYFVIAGTAAVPALPVELHTVLAAAAAAALAGPLDPDLAGKLERDVARMLAAAGYLFDVRAEGGSQINVSGVRNPMYGA